MTLRYIVALSLIALISCAAYYSLRHVVETEDINAAVINISGRQRMLSQRVAFLSDILVQADNKGERDTIRTKMLESADLMKRSHEGLVHGDPAMKLPGNPSQKIHTMYFNAPMFMDKKIRAFLSDVTSLAGAPESRLSHDSPDLLSIQSMALGDLLDCLDKIVRQYQVESESAITELLRLEDMVLAITLLVLLMVGLFIFRPMVRRIKRETQGLRDAENKIHAIVDTIGEGVVSIDEDSHICFIQCH